jgi:hypothetical protein
MDPLHVRVQRDENNKVSMISLLDTLLLVDPDTKADTARQWIKRMRASTDLDKHTTKTSFSRGKKGRGKGTRGGQVAFEPLESDIRRIGHALVRFRKFPDLGDMFAAAVDRIVERHNAPAAAVAPPAAVAAVPVRAPRPLKSCRLAPDAEDNYRRLHEPLADFVTTPVRALLHMSVGKPDPPPYSLSSPHRGHPLASVFRDPLQHASLIHEFFMGGPFFDLCYDWALLGDVASLAESDVAALHQPIVAFRAFVDFNDDESRESADEDPRGLAFMVVRRERGVLVTNALQLTRHRQLLHRLHARVSQPYLLGEVAKRQDELHFTNTAKDATNISVSERVRVWPWCVHPRFNAAMVKTERTIRVLMRVIKCDVQVAIRIVEFAMPEFVDLEWHSSAPLYCEYPSLMSATEPPMVLEQTPRITFSASQLCPRFYSTLRRAPR